MVNTKKVISTINKKALAVDKTKTPSKKDKMEKSVMSKVNKTAKKANKAC